MIDSPNPICKRESESHFPLFSFFLAFIERPNHVTATFLKHVEVESAAIHKKTNQPSALPKYTH